MEKPVLALTMGDPAGIGPEIIVKALGGPQPYQAARPLVVGDAAVLADAVRICGGGSRMRLVSQPADARFELGTIDILDVGQVDPGTVVPGKVQARAGEAAFAYVRKAVELAMAGAVSGMVTAPINKQSLREAGIPYIGHTEMLAGLTGSKEVLTMFVTGSLKVFFLTRHIPLLAACRRISREGVLDGIFQSCRALERLGFAEPRLAVAALNPHAGEGGHLGREEIEQIIPAVTTARERGLAVTGPVPADAVFHLARQGRFDAVLSLYHDQGHIAAKMADFEKTVSLTLGLPFLRSSVDHGTAFDIAGRGIAGAANMLEAVRVAAEFIAGRQAEQS